MPIIRLDALKRFNPALVYLLEPENTGDFEDSYTYLESYVGQQKDIFDALLYAESELLPALEGGFAHLTPEQFILGIKAVHKMAAKTLLRACNRVSGFYTKETILSWENGADFMLPIRIFLSDKSYPCELFYSELKSVYPDLDLSTFVPFLNILLKVRDDETIIIDPAMVEPGNEEVRLGIEALGKLQVAYHKGFLTSVEKELINQYVKVCILPSEIPATMDAYAKASIAKLQSCNRDDLDSVSQVLADIFYDLIKIHPFINGNKRTATILLNTLSCALGHQSIILRHPDESEDQSSLYSQAFAVIDTTRKPLVDLIKHRLMSPPYIESISAQVCEEKSSVLNRLRWLDKKDGREKVTSYLIEMVQAFESRKDLIGLSQKAIEKLFTGYALTQLLTALFKDYESKKTFLKERLEFIAGPEYQWKFYKDKTLAQNPIAYIEFDNEATRDRLAALLIATKSMQVTTTKRVDNQKPVIKLEAFDFAALLEMEPKDAPQQTASLTP